MWIDQKEIITWKVIETKIEREKVIIKTTKLKIVVAKIEDG